MSRTGKTPAYNHVWYQQNQAKIYPWSGESPSFFAVSVDMAHVVESLTHGKQGLGYWLPPDTRTKGFNSHGIDLFSPEHSGFSIRVKNKFSLPDWWGPVPAVFVHLVSIVFLILQLFLLVPEFYKTKIVIPGANVNIQLHQPHMLCCHCLPPGSLHVLGAFGSLSMIHISF